MPIDNYQWHSECGLYNAPVKLPKLNFISKIIATISLSRYSIIFLLFLCILFYENLSVGCLLFNRNFLITLISKSLKRPRGYRVIFNRAQSGWVSIKTEVTLGSHLVTFFLAYIGDIFIRLSFSVRQFAGNT